MLRKVLLVIGLALAALIAWLALNLPPGFGLSDEEIIAGRQQGRTVFLTNCAPCHGGEGNLPTHRDMRQNYSARDIERVLATPPERMPPFDGSATQQRDLLLFLTLE